MRKYLIYFLFVLLCACGPRGGKDVSDAPARREFPSVEVPSMYVDPQERAGYAAAHFWDRFTDTTKVYACDSLTVNGVPAAVLEGQMGLFASLLGELPADAGAQAVIRLYDRADAFKRKFPDSNVFEELGRLTRHYLYDPNSPVRNEDLYSYFVDRLGRSDLIDNGYRMGYEWDARMCSLNRDDVRITDKELIVYGKGAKERTVYLTPISCMYLSAYLYQRTDDNPALFVGLKKPYSRLTAAGAESRLREIGSRAGVEKVHPHRFRRTMATNLLRKGMPLEEVSQVLGHEKLETTLIYAILDKDRVKADHHRYMCA